MLALQDPWASSHGGTLRTRSIAKALDRAGTKVVVLSAGADRSTYADAVPSDIQLEIAPSASRGIRSSTSLFGKVKRNLLPAPTSFGSKSAWLQRRVSELDPDLIVCSFLPLLENVRSHRVPVWVDYSDLLSEFAQRQGRVTGGLPSLTARAQAAGIRRTEKRWNAKARIVTAAGFNEAQIVCSRDAKEAVWLPTPVSGSASRRPASKVAGFIGNFAFGPNRDAARFLAGPWSNELRRHGWRLRVAGYRSSELEWSPDTEVLGEIESIDDFYDGLGATLAPINMGSGMKTKVVESLARGIPVFGTEFAVQGLPEFAANLVRVADLCQPNLSALDVKESAHDDDSYERVRSTFAQSNVDQIVSSLLTSMKF